MRFCCCWCLMNLRCRYSIEGLYFGIEFYCFFGMFHNTLLFLFCQRFLVLFYARKKFILIFANATGSHQFRVLKWNEMMVSWLIFQFRQQQILHRTDSLYCNRIGFLLDLLIFFSSFSLSLFVSLFILVQHLILYST